jgi:hypothetical protein
MSEKEQYSKQIDRLAGSHTLHGSESLCKLLRYLATHALEHPGTSLKEYQIATEVFARRADFDPQLDSTIRVQAGRLRGKLTEYYGSEGTDDPIVVELPKGTYVLQFHHRNGKHPSEATAELGKPEHTASRSFGKGWAVAAVVLALLLVVALGSIAELLNTRSNAGSPATSGESIAPDEFRLFWKPFLTEEQAPWIIFSNAAFVGRPEIGMRYYNPSHDTTGMIWDHYTGVGEVLAVHELDQMFGRLHRQIRVKRGSLFSVDDVRSNDLIFLGSPSENLTLGEIPSTKEFVFQRLAAGPRGGDLAILNVKPQPGEPSSFLASPYTSPLTEDYAVIGLMPGANPGRAVLILAGTTTFGTQGAVEYVCDQNSLHELLSHISLAGDSKPKPFEALLHIKIAHGVPVETQLVSVRERADQ